MEQERSALAEELSAVKVKLADAEKLQTESGEKYQLLRDRYEMDTRVLKGQVENVGGQTYFSVLICMMIMTVKTIADVSDE